MAAITMPVQTSTPNRRRRVRHKIQTPAYASFPENSKSTAMLDLHEIVDISEEGVSLQNVAPLEVNRRVNLCLDLAGCAENIYTTGQVIWSDPTGRTGLRFSELRPASLFRLRDWLFLNAMAGVANADEADVARSSAALNIPPRPSYTDTLTAVTAVQREVEALGADLSAALELIATRTQTLLRASGAALALGDHAPDVMICRASAGSNAPPVGTQLQVGSGFSGECVKTGRLLRCDDSEFDPRVDRESCHALGIRSIIASPVRVGEKSIGILEAFSPQPAFFTETDATVLQRLTETVLAAVNRTARAGDLPLPGAVPAPAKFEPNPGSVLFASAAPEEKKPASDKPPDAKEDGGIFGLPRSLLLLFLMAAAIFLALGYGTAPWIQAKLRERQQIRLQTVLASSQPARPEDAPNAAPAVETATFPQLQQMAATGDAAAENALGLIYFQGDAKNHIPHDEREAFRWFSKAAEDGNLAAQDKLGFLYSAGRGVPKDNNKAYFWTVLARARGDQANKALATVLASNMTRNQATAIEQQADMWLHDHQPHAKPQAGR
jgi:putative methionine-R-sulfoxide reductase with GAF domain